MTRLLRKILQFKFEILFFIFFVVVRLPDLGHDTFNTDVWRWKARTYAFGQGVFTGNFKDTLQKYHPGVTLMWLGTAGVKTYNLYSDIVFKRAPSDNDTNTIFQLDFTQKLFIVLAISFAFTSVFHVLKNLFGLKYALLSTTLLSLEPFILALTRQMHLEGLMTSFMLASILWFYSYLESNKKSHFVISAIFSGLALLTKSSAIFVVLFAGLFFILEIFKVKGDIKSSIKNIVPKGLLWLFIVIATFVIFWPSMWVNPIGTINELYRGVSEVGVEADHIQFYFGKLVDNPGPTFYPVVIAFKSTPYFILGLIFFIFLVYKNSTQEQRKFIRYLFVFATLYLIQFTIPSKKLDRYILPSFAALSLISSFSFYWLFNNLKKIRLPAKVLLVLAFFGPLVYTLNVLHPDYLSYYNPMFGGLQRGIYVLEPKWMIGTNNIVRYFSDLKKTENLKDAPDDTSLEELIDNRTLKYYMTVGFQEKYYTQIWPFFRETKSWAVIDGLAGFARQTKYFVYPVWDDRSSNESRFKLQYFGDIKIRNVVVYKVYKRIS